MSHVSCGFQIYIGLYLTACLAAAGLVWRRARSYRELWAAYRPFLFVRWKLTTFVIAAGILTVIAPFSNDPTWDYPDSIVMSVLTFLSAPWSVGVLFRRRSRFDERFLAVCLWGVSASWSYDLYMWWRDGSYPVTWLANVFASSLMYLSAGLFWNLEWLEGKGVVFAFTRPDWLTGDPARSGFRRIAWAAGILMALVAGIIAPFLWYLAPWNDLRELLFYPGFYVISFITLYLAVRATGWRGQFRWSSVVILALWLTLCSVCFHSLREFQKAEGEHHRIENLFGADIVVPPGMAVENAEGETFDAWLRSGSAEPDLRLKDLRRGPGIYKIAASLGTPVSGTLELRIFEAVRNTPIPYQHDLRNAADEHRPPIHNVLIHGNPYWVCSGIVISKGGYKHKYPARFELWAVDSGKKAGKLLLKKSYWINGWLR